MKVDVLFLCCGRNLFTAASLWTLCRNTARDLVDRLCIFTDGDTIPPAPLCGPLLDKVEVNTESFGGPVAIMNAFLARPGRPVFAKIDNDTIVPPGWLEQTTTIMERAPQLGLLGIEPPASRTPSRESRQRSPKPELDGPLCLVHENPDSDFAGRERVTGLGYAPAPSIGGIGLMRRSAWAGRAKMHPHGFNGVGGFTNWQTSNPDLLKGWTVPPLNVFLLDRLPLEPWTSLSDLYIRTGVQRAWTKYSPADSALWDWWTPDQRADAVRWLPS